MKSRGMVVLWPQCVHTALYRNIFICMNMHNDIDFKQYKTNSDIPTRWVVVYIRSEITHYCRDEHFVNSVN